MGWLGFPPCRPPCNPPAKPPFRATKRMILWGGLFRGKTHFRRGNLALLNPCGGGQWARRSSGIMARPAKRHPQEKGKRKGRPDRQPPKGAICALERHKNYAVHIAASRVRSTAKRHALDTVRVRGNNDTREGNDRRKDPSLSIPVRNCRLIFYGMNCIIIQRTKAVRRWKEKRKMGNSSINLEQRRGGR